MWLAGLADYASQLTLRMQGMARGSTRILISWLPAKGFWFACLWLFPWSTAPPMSHRLYCTRICSGRRLGKFKHLAISFGDMNITCELLPLSSALHTDMGGMRLSVGIAINILYVSDRLSTVPDSHSLRFHKIPHIVTIHQRPPSGYKLLCMAQPQPKRLCFVKVVTPRHIPLRN